MKLLNSFTTPLRVQSAHQAAGSTSVVLAFSSNNTVGNFIVVGIEANVVGSVLPTISDSQGNVYNKSIAAPQQNAGGTAQEVMMFHAANIKAGANTVTVGVAGASYMNIVIAEFSSVSTTNPLDGGVAGTNGNSAAPASGSFPVDGNLVIGMAMNGVGGMGAGSGFISLGTDTFSMMEYQVANSTSANAIYTSSSGQWAAIGVSFTPSRANSVLCGAS